MYQFFINTYHIEQINAALAEAIKYGFIYDRELFDFIASKY
jgi:3-dehydroquinate synthetase